MKVADLKEECKKRKLPVGGNKQDLVDRLNGASGDTGDSDEETSSKKQKVEEEAPKESKKEESPSKCKTCHFGASDLA